MKTSLLLSVLLLLVAFVIATPLDVSKTTSLKPRQENLLPFCAACALTCSAGFVACAAFCIVPADPACAICLSFEAEDGLEEYCMACTRCLFLQTPPSSGPPDPSLQARVDAARSDPYTLDLLNQANADPRPVTPEQPPTMAPAGMSSDPGAATQ